MQPHIAAIDFAVPAKSQSAEELARIVGRSESWVRENVGVHRRYVSQVTDDPAALAASIARPIIEQVGKPDLVIHAGAMPRQLLPDTSVFVLDLLQLHGVPGFSVNSACLSFLTAVQVAAAFVASGTHERVLICTSEFGTRGRNFAEPEAACLIGDGAAAAMVCGRDSEPGILHNAMQTFPSGAKLAEVRGGGVMRPPSETSTEPQDNLFHGKTYERRKLLAALGESFPA